MPSFLSNTLLPSWIRSRPGPKKKSPWHLSRSTGQCISSDLILVCSNFYKSLLGPGQVAILLHYPLWMTADREVLLPLPSPPFGANQGIYSQPTASSFQAGLASHYPHPEPHQAVPQTLISLFFRKNELSNYLKKQEFNLLFYLSLVENEVIEDKQKFILKMEK